MSDLTKGDSVWGVVASDLHVRFWDAVNEFADSDKLSVYRQKAVSKIESLVVDVVKANSDDVWDDVVGALQAAWPNETLHWNESPRELITRLINERDELTAKLKG